MFVLSKPPPSGRSAPQDAAKHGISASNVPPSSPSTVWLLAMLSGVRHLRPTSTRSPWQPGTPVDSPVVSSADASTPPLLAPLEEKDEDDPVSVSGPEVASVVASLVSVMPEVPDALVGDDVLADVVELPLSPSASLIEGGEEKQPISSSDAPQPT